MTTATLTASATARGILLPCPCCGEASATITLNLADGGLHCQDCDADFERADVEAFIAKWQRVFTWIDARPTE